MNAFTSTDLHYSREVSEQRPVRAAGIWKRFLNALMESRQRQAEREVARYIHLNGGKLTDDIERRIEQRLMHG